MPNSLRLHNMEHSNQNKISKENLKLFFLYLMDKKDIAIKLVNGKLFTNGFITNGLYSNSNYENKYKIIEGRFLNESDFKNNEKVAVIPKEACKYEENIDGCNYIVSGNEKYKVIGIIDSGKSDQTMFNTIFYNLNIEEINSDLSLNEIVIESNKYSFDYLKNYVCNNPYVQIYNIENRIYDKVDNFAFIKIGVFSFMRMYCPLILVILISLLLSTHFWINSISREIGIKKICGGSTIDILKEIIIRLFLVSVVALVICPFVQNFLEDINIMNRSIEYTSLNSKFNVVFMLLISTTLSITSFYKIDKLEPINLIRKR